MLLNSFKSRKIIYNALSAVIVSGFTYFLTKSLPYYPSGWQWLLVFTIGLLTFFKPALGIVFSSLLFILPISYISLNLGLLYIAFLILLAIFKLLKPFPFFVLGLSSIIATNPKLYALEILVPLLSGFSGVGLSPILASFGCFLLEIIGILEGVPSIGLLSLGAKTKPLIALHTKPVDSLRDFAWLNQSLSSKNITPKFESVLTPFLDRPILVSQIIVWAITAGVFSYLWHKSKDLKTRIFATVIGALTFAVSTLTMSSLILGTKISQSVIESALSSAIFGILFTLAGAPLWEILSSPLFEATHLEITSPSSNDEEEKRGTSSRKEIPQDTWDDLAGIEDIKEELMDVIKSQFDINTRKALSKMNITPPRGILLFGPPGTGKTKIARIIAHEANASFFAVSGTEFTSMWYGQSEANLRAIFEEAYRNRPSVLLFDELEAFLPNRSELSRSDAPEKGIVGTFLSYTDGLKKIDGVLLVGATNHPELIDPAALRPGRFDKVIYIGPLGKEGRLNVLNHYLEGKSLDSDVDLDKIAERMERFTGADIQLVCNEVAKIALKRDKKNVKIKMEDFEAVLSGTKPSVTIEMLQEYEKLAQKFMRRSAKVEQEDVVEHPQYDWNDVVGLDNVKESLFDTVEMPLVHPELLKEYAVKASKGILLFGPPGCGKTFLGKVIASKANANFIYIKGPELLNKYIGESESAIRKLFIQARENKPCILFFDEIDAIAGKRGTENETKTKILTQLLTEMDGMEELDGVVIIGATNTPETLDPALLRPGRFDRILYVAPPTKEARIELFKKELKNRPIDPNIDYEKLAELTELYTPADIHSICNAVALSVAKASLKENTRKVITTDDILEQIKRTQPSVSAEEVKKYEEISKRMER